MGDNRLPVNVEREARESFRNALLVLLNAISEDKDVLRTLAKRDPKAIEQAVEALRGEVMTQYFSELLTYIELQVGRCREITSRIEERAAEG